MQYCAEHALPHSKFLSWNDEDRDKVIAYILFERGRCPKCGSFPNDWVNEAGEEVEPPPMFVHTQRCFGCATLELVEDRLRKEQRHDTRAYLSTLPPPPRDEDDEEWEDELT